MKKNYEELKRFLQSEEQVIKEQKYYHVSKMRMDDEQIITSYPESRSMSGTVCDSSEVQKHIDP